MQRFPTSNLHCPPPSDGWCLEAFTLAQGRMLNELRNVLIMLVVGKVSASPHQRSLLPFCSVPPRVRIGPFPGRQSATLGEIHLGFTRIFLHEYSG